MRPPTRATQAMATKKTDAYYSQCRVLRMQLLKCVAIAMGLAHDCFVDTTKQAGPRCKITRCFH